MTITETRWVKCLRFLLKLTRKRYFFVSASISSFYYVDLKEAYVVVPELEGESKMKNVFPKVFCIRDDHAMIEASNVEYVKERFMDYARSVKFSL